MWFYAKSSNCITACLTPTTRHRLNCKMNWSVLNYYHPRKLLGLCYDLILLELTSGTILFRLVCNLAANVDIKSESAGFFFSELFTLLSFVPSRIDANRLALPA